MTVNPNSTEGRVHRALVELWQDHQAAYPVGHPARSRMSVDSRGVRDLANLRGGRVIMAETVQNAGRVACRQGRTDLGDGLRFSYAKGRFDVWEET